MNIASPFSSARFEYEQQNLYFLPDYLMKTLVQFRPIYMIGSRGTGKTTFLRALWWEERMRNPNLGAALPEDELFDSFIGIYFKLPVIQTSIFSDWAPELKEADKGRFFSLYLELLICHQAVAAVRMLAQKGLLDLSVADELAVVKEIANDYSIGLPGELQYQERPALMDLEKAIWDAHTEMVEMVRLQLSADKFNMVPLAAGYGTVCRKILGHLCETSALKDMHFKVCFDECECLSFEQQVVINTIIRTTEFPVTYVVAYVSQPSDMNATYISGLTLQLADREVLPLDAYTEDDRKFEEFVDGVATVRIKKVLELNEDFRTRRFLGDLCVNELLMMRLKSSEGEKAREIVSDAEQYAQLPFYQDQRTGAEEAGDILPIYQSYLTKVLNLEVPEVETPGWIRRDQESREIRKKMVGAYLSICRESGDMDVWYARTEMVLQISDSCIRDYLWQMQSLLDVAKGDLLEFMRGTASVHNQALALKKYSEKKFGSIFVNDKIRRPEKTARMIEALANITRIVQSESPDYRHLRSPERGIFRLNAESSYGPAGRDLVKIIFDAGEAGFLKILSAEDYQIRFRVHTSLAPRFGFSYRGAYYEIPITFPDLLAMVQEGGKGRQEKILDVGRRISGYTVIDEPLFEGKNVWAE